MIASICFLSPSEKNTHKILFFHCFVSCSSLLIYMYIDNIFKLRKLHLLIIRLQVLLSQFSLKQEKGIFWYFLSFLPHFVSRLLLNINFLTFFLRVFVFSLFAFLHSFFLLSFFTFRKKLFTRQNLF